MEGRRLRLLVMFAEAPRLVDLSIRHRTLAIQRHRFSA